MAKAKELLERAGKGQVNEKEYREALVDIFLSQDDLANLACQLLSLDTIEGIVTWDDKLRQILNIVNKNTIVEPGCNVCPAITFLIEKGANPHIKGYAPHYSALYVAEQCHDRNLIRLLVSRGVDVNFPTDGTTLLHRAAQWAIPDQARFLIEIKADVNVAEALGNTPLHYAARHSPEITGFLIENKADIHAKNKKGETALRTQATLSAISVLLESKADVTSTDARGHTVLENLVSESLTLGNLSKLILITSYAPHSFASLPWTSLLRDKYSENRRENQIMALLFSAHPNFPVLYPFFYGLPEGPKDATLPAAKVKEARDEEKERAIEFLSSPAGKELLPLGLLPRDIFLAQQEQQTRAIKTKQQKKEISSAERVIIQGTLAKAGIKEDILPSTIQQALSRPDLRWKNFKHKLLQKGNPSISLVPENVIDTLGQALTPLEKQYDDLENKVETKVTLPSAEIEIQRTSFYKQADTSYRLTLLSYFPYSLVIPSEDIAYLIREGILPAPMLPPIKGNTAQELVQRMHCVDSIRACLELSYHCLEEEKEGSNNVRTLAAILVKSATRVKKTPRWQHIWRNIDALPHIRDALVDCSQSLVLAHKVKKALTQGQEMFDLEKEGDKAVVATATTLFDGMALSKIIAFSNLWHRANVQAKLSKEKIGNDANWVPLLKGPYYPQIEESKGEGSRVTRKALLEGIHLVSLNNTEELRIEGKTLGHCVGTGNYARRCISGDIRIVSIRGKDGILSTAELALDITSKKVMSHQHYGERNRPPSAAATQLLEQFVTHINSEKGSQLVDWEALGKSKKKSFREQAIHVLQFNVMEPGKLKQVQETYRKELAKPVKGKPTLLGMNFITLLATLQPEEEKGQREEKAIPPAPLTIAASPVAPVPRVAPTIVEQPVTEEKVPENVVIHIQAQPRDASPTPWEARILQNNKQRTSRCQDCIIL